MVLHLLFSFSFLVECNKLGEKEKRRGADLEKIKIFLFILIGKCQQRQVQVQMISFRRGLNPDI
jgi:hypothetical protein